jgi:hypothetical protein
MTKYCSRCGTPNDDNAIYCKQCGSQFTPVPPPVQPTYQQLQQPTITFERPTAAFVLSLIGGIFVLLAGLFVMLVGALLTFFAFGVGGAFGLLGVIWGIIIIVGAAMLNSHPSDHVLWGVIILVFSIISWIGAVGGFFIGFLLGLIGGILAIVGHPAHS